MRDKCVCTYCGWDGKVWPNYLYLSVDHLLPKEHPKYCGASKSYTDDYMVTACIFCNNALQWSLKDLKGLDVDGKTPSQLVEIRRKLANESRERIRKTWKTYFEPSP
jgi:hypothetical protein